MRRRSTHHDCHSHAARARGEERPCVVCAYSLTHVVLQEGHAAQAEEKDVDLILLQIPTAGGPVATVDFPSATK